MINFMNNIHLESKHEGLFRKFASKIPSAWRTIDWVMVGPQD
jgi:hypothetical protein